MGEFQKDSQEGLWINPVTSLEKVNEVINYFDTVFTPTMSQRFSNLEKYSEKIFQHANIFVVEDDHQYIGLTVFYANNEETKTAYLSLMGVIPQFQSKGIGSLLINECIRISKSNGMRKVKLEVFLPNSKAINLYQNTGFNFLGRATSESIYMLKEL